MNHKNPTPDAHDILSNGETITAMTMSGLFQALPFAVILHGPDGVIFDCNEAACRLFGYSRREMRLLRHGDLLPENLLRIGPGSAATDMTTNGAFLWVSRRDKFGMLFQCEYSSRRVTIDGSDYSSQAIAGQSRAGWRRRICRVRRYPAIHHGSARQSVSSPGRKWMGSCVSWGTIRRWKS